jgi:hypothetical protein
MELVPRINIVDEVPFLYIGFSLTHLREVVQARKRINYSFSSPSSARPSICLLRGDFRITFQYLSGHIKEELLDNPVFSIRAGSELPQKLRFSNEGQVSAQVTIRGIVNLPADVRVEMASDLHAFGRSFLLRAQHEPQSFIDLLFLVNVADTVPPAFMPAHKYDGGN